MSKKHEVVIIGGGHGGLGVASYLAKAGVDVCVVEAQAFVGGGVATREVAAPGFKTDLCSVWHGFIQPNPMILHDELGLKSKFGLKYVMPNEQATTVFDDDSFITLYKDLDDTCQSIAKFSEHDAEAYRKFYDWSIKSLDMLTEGMYNPPAPFGTMVSMLDQSEEGRLLLRSLMMSACDIVDDWFESTEVKTMLTRYASEDLVSVQEKGSGFVLFVFVPLSHKYGAAFPVGGSGALSESMERCILHYGGTVLTSSPVEKVIVQGGEAKGVIVKGGEEILATKAVISNLNAKQIPDLVGVENLPETFVTNLKNLKFSPFQCIRVGLALHEAPKFTAGDAFEKSTLVEYAPRDYEEYLRAFHQLELGYMPYTIPLTTTVTLVDPTRAPEGKHTCYLYSYAPYNLADGGPAKWDEIKGEVEEGLLNTVRNHTTNMGADNIIGIATETPLDLERRNPAMIRGDFCHLGMTLSQEMGNRYLPGWNYKTPVKNFWMCGPSTHPGIGVTGGGRAAAQAIMEAIGVDFEKAIAK